MFNSNEQSSSFRFTWYINGQICLQDMEILVDKNNRCIVCFPFAKAGEYKVTAQNDYGSACSFGRIEIQGAI